MLFEGDHSAEATTQWLQDLEQEMRKRQRASQQPVPSECQHWLLTLEHAKPQLHSRQRSSPEDASAKLTAASLHGADPGLAN